MRNFGLIVGGTIGILLAWRRVSAATRQADAVLRQADRARRDHVAELFNRAVGQLTDDKLEIRLGAVYTLRQIARDFPDLAEPAVQLLSTYLRERVEDHTGRVPPADVREIVRTMQDFPRAP